MSGTAHAARRWTLVALTIALAGVLLVAAIVILPYRVQTAKTTEATVSASSTTSLRTSFTTQTTSEYNSSLGLNLTMSIAPTTILENGGVSLYLSLNNTLAAQNNLTRPAGIDLPSSSYETCSQLPVGDAIFQGNYGVANASQGESLGLISPNEEVVNGCPGFPIAWSFAPTSNNITNRGVPAVTNVTYWGYWAYDAGDVFRPFSPGIYTIEGQDYWGQETFLHFQVDEDQNPLDCATIASNSSFLSYANGSAGPGPLKLDAYYQNPRTNNTVVLALTNTENLTLKTYDTASVSPSFTDFGFVFSPDPGQINAWRYYASNGTLGYPGSFNPDQCVLVSVTFSSPLVSTQFSVTVNFANNQSQTFASTP